MEQIISQTANAKAALAVLPYWVKTVVWLNAMLAAIALLMIARVAATQTDMLAVMINATVAAEAAGGTAVNLRTTLNAVGAVSADGLYWIYGLFALMVIVIGISSFIVASAPSRISHSLLKK